MNRNSIEEEIDSLLYQPETALTDEEFSNRVMHRLPARRVARSHSRRWTLGIAAASGSALTALIAPPIEPVLQFYALDPALTTILTAALMASIIAIPVVWIMQSDW